MVGRVRTGQTGVIQVRKLTFIGAWRPMRTRHKTYNPLSQSVMGLTAAAGPRKRATARRANRPQPLTGWLMLGFERKTSRLKKQGAAFNKSREGLLGRSVRTEDSGWSGCIFIHQAAHGGLPSDSPATCQGRERLTASGGTGRATDQVRIQPGRAPDPAQYGANQSRTLSALAVLSPRHARFVRPPANIGPAGPSPTAPCCEARR